MDWLGRVQVELTATPQQESDAESCTDEHQPMQEKEVSPICVWKSRLCECLE